MVIKKAWEDDFWRHMGRFFEIFLNGFHGKMVLKFVWAGPDSRGGTEDQPTVYYQLAAFLSTWSWTPAGGGWQ